MEEDKPKKKDINSAEVIIDKTGRRHIVAADSAARVNEVTKAGAWQGFEPLTGNKFKLYEQMGDLNPHISIPLTKLALSLVKGVRFVDGDTSSPNEELLKDFKMWSEQIDFRSKLQSFSRLLIKNGTFVGQTIETKVEGVEGGKVFDFQPVLMKYTTLLPAKVKPGDKPDFVMTPPIVSAYINEGDEDLQQQIKSENLIYGAIFPWDKPFVDVKGRETYGMYGLSSLDAIHDTFMRYIDLVKGYTEYIRKYGVGRYFFNYKALEDVLKDGDVDTVKKLIEELRDTVQYLQENEDIVGCGFEIKSLDQSGTNIDIVNFKNSLETDIQVGLLQQPLTMGRAEGTTYASGYVSEADRLIVLEGLQKLIQDIVNKQIIDKRLISMSKEVGSVRVIFEELSQPSIVYKDLLLGYEDGLFSRKEMRVHAGKQPDITDEEIMEGRNLVTKNTPAKDNTRIESAEDETTVPKAPSRTPSRT